MDLVLIISPNAIRWSGTYSGAPSDVVHICIQAALLTDSLKFGDRSRDA